MSRTFGAASDVQSSACVTVAGTACEAPLVNDCISDVGLCTPVHSTSASGAERASR